MSDWKQISLRDAVGKVVFDDEWGFIKFDGNISYSVGGRDLSSYYIEEDGTKKQITPGEYSAKELMDLFSEKLYYRNNNYGYYNRNQQGFFSVEFEEITVSFSASDLRKDAYAYGGRNSHTYSFVIKKQNKRRLEYLRRVWICNEIQDGGFAPDKYLKQPYFKQLKESDEILFNGGKHRIVVVYEQPNENGYMVAAVPNYEGAAGKAVNIPFNDKVYVLPYKEQPASETERFNTCKNELDLSPYAVKAGTCLNIYWNKVQDAAGYIVSVYKKYDRPYLQKIYHLKDYSVDRNDGFASIDGFTDDWYIVTVKAESRDGEEIALSRGIWLNGNGRCVPQFWKE